jgi:hypothetical protein
MISVADRHLLFGLHALQKNSIDQVQLVAAFEACTRDKPKSVADYLEIRGDSAGAKRALLEMPAEFHLEAHGKDIEKSLTAVPANRFTRASPVQLGEPEIEATLARLIQGKDGHANEIDHYDGPDRTAAPRVGCSTGKRSVVPHPATTRSRRSGRGLTGSGCGGAPRGGSQRDTRHPRQRFDNRQRFPLEAKVTDGMARSGIEPVYGLGVYANGRSYDAIHSISYDSRNVALTPTAINWPDNPQKL